MHLARLSEPPLPVQASADLPSLNVGCSGWYYRHWRQSFYPEDLAAKDWFSHYTENISTVELNASFYSWPSKSTLKTWLKQAGSENMIYTVKVNESITHVKRFVGTEDLVKDFGIIADFLGNRMGCFLFQLPPSYSYSPARLKSILAQMEPSRRNVVEFRHRSWWNENVYAAFRKSGTIFCSCSAPKLADELISTTDEIYIRFHGLTKWYRHDYTNEELAEWVRKIKNSRCKRVWAYFNNDRDANAIKNAIELTQMLREEN